MWSFPSNHHNIYINNTIYKRKNDITTYYIFIEYVPFLCFTIGFNNTILFLLLGVC